MAKSNVIDSSIETDLTFYDAAYISLAKHEAVPLLTGDDMVFEAAKRSGISVSYVG